MQAFPGLSYAQARPLVFATFTGSWEEAHKAVLVPAFRKANADAEIVLDPMLSVDQIAKVKAAQAQSADRRDAARSGSGAGRDRPGPGRALSRSRRAPTTRT